jgi:diguanylate cyclase
VKYIQKREASEELLRLTIQRMAPQPAAFSPHTYTVWYEYILGINPRLNADIDRLLEDKRKIDDDAIARLYQRYIADERQEEVTRILREDVRHLLGKLIALTRDTDNKAQLYGSNLQSFGKQLLSLPDTDSLNDLIDQMVSDTNTMHGSMDKLHRELEHSRDEVGNLQKELESARREALIDPLTGIYNRRGFEIQANKMIADGEIADKGLCLLMVDIDHFKKINDTYGHVLGDRVIRTMANTLKSKVKGQDSVARLGGEEFVVLLPETSPQGALTVAEHIRASIEHGKIRRPNSQDTIASITVSVGIAVYQAGETLEDWLDHADKALYASKQGGRNKVTAYEPQEAD